MNSAPEDQATTDSSAGDQDPAEDSATLGADFFTRLFGEEERLRAQPPTDKQLALIWPLWSAQTQEMLPEEKCIILTGAFDETHPEYRLELEELIRRNPEAELPLDRNEYHQALNRASRWSSLTGFVQTTLGLHQDLVARQWAFAEADSHASGRVAIFRAANELRLLRPGFLELTAPTVADIAHLENRYSAYSDAREQALNALSDLVFKVPGMRTGKELPWDERALGVPNPPPDMLRHLYVARLDALGICSAKRLKGTSENCFSELS